MQNIKKKSLLWPKQILKIIDKKHHFLNDFIKYSVSFLNLDNVGILFRFYESLKKIGLG